MSPDGPNSFTADGITVDSNTETTAELQAALAATDAPPTPEAKVDNPDAQVDNALAEPPAAVDESQERDPATGQFKPRNRRDDPREAVKSAVAKQREAERERDALKAERAAWQAERDAARRPATPPQPPATPTADPEPQEKDFDDYRLYVKAQARWEARQEYAEREKDRIEQTQRQQDEHDHRTVETTWQTRLTEARTADPTFDTRINWQTPMSLPMMHVIKTSDLGLQLLQYLSDNPDTAQRLSTLPPPDALREMGKLEARVDAAPSRGPAPALPVSHAKAPIKPLGTSPQTVSDAEPGDDASDDEWLRYQLRAKRR